jgi:hypothetical protein
MQVNAALDVQRNSAASGSAPPSPKLSAVEQGDVAAGRAAVVEGQVYPLAANGSPSGAPPVARWGDEPASSPYRQTFDRVSARLGTNDNEKVGAEIDRQIGAAAKSAPAAKPADAGKGKPIVMDGGHKGDWSPELNSEHLKADAEYIVNGYDYHTDGKGRVVEASGDLELKSSDRNPYQQEISGRDDRLPTDQGGHLIATIFHGPGDRLNLVPMNGNLNVGAWKKMENGFAEALKAGKSVDVDIKAIYSGDSTRPTHFVIDAKVGGEPKTFTFRNQAGG